MIMFFIILVFNGLFQQQSLHATNLYDAVNDSVEYARDDSSRMSRGTFVINYPKFVNRLNQYQIEDIHKSPNDKIPYVIYILRDNNSVDSNNGEGASLFSKHASTYDEKHPLYNSHINAMNYNKGNAKNNKYIAIRGIQVQVLKSKEHFKTQSKDLIDPSKANDKYIATFIVQESDTDPSYIKGHDLQGDTSTNNRSANKPNYYHTGNGFEADKKAFYKNQQSTYDATTPSYPTEDKQ